jgi:hypothetical protein
MGTRLRVVHDEEDTMKLTGKNMVELENVIKDHWAVNVTRVAWMLTRNKAKIERPLADMRKMIAPTEAQMVLFKERDELVKAHATLNAQGKPNARVDERGNTTYPIADQEAFAAAMAELVEKHPQAETDRLATVVREKELLETEVDFEPYTMSHNDVPDGTFSAEAIDVLFRCGILVD